MKKMISEYDGYVIEDMARAVAGTEEYVEGRAGEDELGEFLGRDFGDLVNITRKSVGIILERLPDGASESDVAEVLASSFRADVGAGAVRSYEGKLVFPVAVRRSRDVDEPVEVSIRRSDGRAGSRAWFTTYVNTYVKRPSPTRALEEWGWHGPWSDFLAELEAIALPERWDFDAGERPLEVLRSYVFTTFYRLQVEKKVLVGNRGRFAAWNSGLLDDHMDEILVCYERDSEDAGWRFCGFACCKNRKLRKRVVSLFNPLPQTASYVDDPGRLVFDVRRPLEVDFEHVIGDHLDRLPLGFLSEAMRFNGAASRILDEIGESGAGADAGALYAGLKSVLDADPALFCYVRARLEDAVSKALQRTKFNFKTALPSYFPRKNSLCHLLPICLSSDRHADAALVVELQPSGSYLGQTILSKGMAYRCARLICRPDSDWLVPD